MSDGDDEERDLAWHLHLSVACHIERDSPRTIFDLIQIHRLCVDIIDIKVYIDLVEERCGLFMLDCSAFPEANFSNNRVNHNRCPFDSNKMTTKPRLFYHRI